MDSRRQQSSLFLLVFKDVMMTVPQGIIRERIGQFLHLWCCLIHLTKPIEEFSMSADFLTFTYTGLPEALTAEALQCIELSL